MRFTPVPLVTVLVVNGLLGLSELPHAHGAGVPVTHDLALWLDANDVDGDGTSGGTLVTSGTATWVDRSGNGHDVSQSNAADHPTTGSTMNGLPVLSFSGSQYLYRADALGFTGNPGVTVFIVTDQSSNARSLQFGKSGNPNGGYILGFQSDSSWRFNNGNRVFGNHGLYGVGAAIGVWRTEANQGYGDVEFFRNGPTPATQTSAGLNNSPLSGIPATGVYTKVGGGWNGNRAYYDDANMVNGTIAEIVVYSVALSDEELEQVGYYLQSKWGVSAGSFTPSGPPTVDSHTPGTNAVDVLPDADVAVTFSDSMDAGTVGPASFAVTGSVSGAITGSYSVNGTVVTFDPSQDFAGGEEVTVTLTTNLQSSTALALETPYTWQFTVDTNTYFDFTQAAFSTPEGDTTATNNTVTVVRTGVRTSPSSVDVVLAGDTATAGSDFTAGTLTLNFAAGETTKNVPIEILGDAVVELDETINLSFTNFSGTGQAGLTQPTAVLTLANDDSATLTIADTSVVEGDTTTSLVFSVTLDAAVDVGLTCNYATLDGTAEDENGSGDYQSTTGVVSFAGTLNEVHTITVPVTGDTTLEGNETLELLLDGLQASDRGISLAGPLNVPDTWTQLGADIDGEAAYDTSGRAVRVNADGTTVVIGAPLNDGTASSAGHARIYRFDGTSWTQLGADIDGEAAGDNSGYSVDISADGNTVIIGAHQNDGNGGNSGHARVHRFDGTSWTQLGADIDGEAAGDRFGYSVGLSADGNTAVIGTPYNDGGGSSAGHARIYRFDGTSWTQLGDDIDGEAAGDLSGYSVDLSDDGNTVAIGATRNDGSNGNDSGHVRVFRFDGTSWIQLGEDIDGEAGGDQSGWSLGLSGNATTVVIGAPYNADGGGAAGHARVYRFDGTSWTQLGADIDGEAGTDFCGEAAAASADGNTVVIGARGNDGNGNGAGHVRVYRYDGTSWTQLATDIDGEAGGDQSGWSADVSGDGTTIIVGAYDNDDNGHNSGHARVFRYSAGGVKATGTIEDDEIGYDFAQASFAVNEGDVTGVSNEVQVVRTASHVASSVDVALADDTATAGSDYTAGPVTLNFGIGETTKAVPIEILGDAVVELDETIDLSFTNFSGSGQAGLTTATAVLTLLNDDSATLTIADTSVVEGDMTTSLVFTVTLDAAVDVGLTCDYATIDVTAEDENGDGDYQSTTGVVSFAGTLNEVHTITVPVTGDDTLEPNETLELILQDIATSGRAVSVTGSTIVPETWTQMGADIHGEAAYDSCGGAVAVSEDGNTVVLGAAQNDGGASGSGHARVFRFDGTSWIQLGGDIDGAAANDYNGASVSVNADGNTIAIGASGTDGNGYDSGHVQVYRLVGNTWTQLGGDMVGEAAYDRSGSAVDLSADGNTVIIGAGGNDGAASDAGHARVYRFDGTAWTQLGADIDGEAVGDRSARNAVGISADGHTVVIGALFNDGNGLSSGHARIYRFDGTAWTQLGADIDGEAAGDASGIAVDMSADGNAVIIGADVNGGNGTAAGHARVFRFDGTSWVQVGADIDGEAAYDRSADRVSMSADGNTVIIGAGSNDGSGTDAGHARVYRFSGTAWGQVGADIDGVAEYDHCGAGVAVSANGKAVIVGAYGNDHNGTGAGQVRIFRLTPAKAKATGTIENDEMGYDFTQASVSFNEGDAMRVTNAIQVVRMGTHAASSVDVVLAGDTATAGSDFTAGPITLNFAIGETTKPVPTEILGDAVVELDETIDLSLANFSGDGQAGFTQPTTVLTLANDDSATLTIADTSVVEGDTTTSLVFTVTLDAAVDVGLTCDYATIDVTAEDENGDGDYQSTTGTVSFAGNLNEVHTITVPVTGDDTLEGNETLELLLDELQASNRDVSLAGTFSLPGGWPQLGADIDGEAAGDQFGVSVDVSADGNTVIIGGPYNDGDGSNAGHAQVYRFDGTSWTQMGSDIEPGSASDLAGRAVAMSADGNTVVVGAPLNDVNGSASGRARAHRFDGTSWVQIGADIDGEAAGDWLGQAVDIDADGDTIALGAWGNDANGTASGHTRIYRFDGATWTQLGSAILGEAANDTSGKSVSISADGTTVIIGATGNDGNGTSSGHARVYRYDGTSWTQLGADIDGESSGDNSGWSVDVNADGSTVVIGAIYNSDNGTYAGQARVYRFDGTSWSQLGADIDGEAAGDGCGYSVSISADGNTILLGSNAHDGNGSNAGHARVFRYDGMSWTQLAAGMEGESANDQAAVVSLSADGGTAIIGSFYNDGNGTDAGHARIFRYLDGPVKATGTIEDDDGGDLGDLPADYGLTLLADNGAQHLLPVGLSGHVYLGATLDAETNGLESANADGDDTNADDEDGITVVGQWYEGELGGGKIEVTVTGGSGYLSGWVDWNDDNDFADAGEQVLNMSAVNAGTQTVLFDVPSGSIPDVQHYYRYARFRLSAASGPALTPTGTVLNGEVEDYLLDIDSVGRVNPPTLFIFK